MRRCECTAQIGPGLNERDEIGKLTDEVERPLHTRSN